MGYFFTQFCAGPAFSLDLVEQYFLFVGDGGDQMFFSPVRPLKVFLGVAELCPQMGALTFQFLVTLAQLDEVALHLLVFFLVAGHFSLCLFGVT